VSFSDLYFDTNFIAASPSPILKIPMLAIIELTNIQIPYSLGPIFLIKKGVKRSIKKGIIRISATFQTELINSFLLIMDFR